MPQQTLISCARKTALAFALLLGGALLSGIGMSSGAAGSAPPGPIDSLAYTVRTQYAEGGAVCAGERTTKAQIGVPTLVDVGGSFLPDALVTVVAVPGVGGGPDLLELVVTKLRVGQLRALVEAVITPDTAAAGRVSAGPNGCETGLPGVFSATVTSSESRLALLATTVAPTATITVIGSAFDAAGDARADATEVSTRLSPVPTLVKATIDIEGPSSYRASLKTSRPTDLTLSYDDSSGASRTAADARVRTFPGELDLTFTEQEIAYTSSAPMDRVDIELESVSPGERTSRMRAELTGVPVTATLLRDGPTHVTFTTPTRIGSALMTFADFEPGTTVPVLENAPGQYLATRVQPDVSVATVKVIGLSHADIDAGDPVLVDVRHTAGPFHVIADLVGDQTRHLEVDVLDLPATARITYSPSSQEFTYDGSAEIAELTADVTSSAPFVGNARESHLKILDLPTGLEGHLDAAGKTFDATMTGGAIGTLEVQVTSGQDKRLAEGQQGLLVSDVPAAWPFRASYDAFVRVRGLESARLSWGTTQLAHVTHLPGPFAMQVDTAALDIDGLIQDLPHQAYVSYGPAVATPPEVPADGPSGGGELDPVDELDQSPDLAAGKSFVYRGSEPINQVRFDVVASEPIFDDATDAHIDLLGLPREVVVTMLEDSRQAVVATKHGAVGSIDIELCSEGACDPPPTGPPSQSDGSTSPDGLWVDDLSDSYHATAHLTGLTRLDLSWGDVVSLRMLHAERRFAIDLQEDKFAGEFSEIEYPVTTKVVIDAVPADAKLTYDPDTQHVTYRGSAPIGLIDANHTIGTGVNTHNDTAVPPPAAIVGRATSAHLVVTDLPTGLDLTFEFGETSEKLVIDAGGHAVGHISLDLLSSPDILGFPQFSGHPVVAGTQDGLLFWDLDDFVAPAGDPRDDPFAIAVRVTNLQRFVSKRDDISAEGATAADRTIELNRQGVGSPDIQVEILLSDNTESAHLLALGDGDEHYRFAQVNVTYAAPPPRFGFWFRQVKGSAGGQQFEFKYYASAPGGRIDFFTTAGASLDTMSLDVFPVPAGGGTLSTPGLAACFSPDALWCYDEHEVEDAHDSEVSFFVRVTQPVRLEVDATTTGDQRIIANLNISDVLIVSKEVRWDPVDDNTFIFIDTEGTPIDGVFKVYDDGDRDMSVHIPVGFRAYARFVELLKPNIGETRGRLVCPAGFDIEEDWGFNLEHRVCPSPRLDGVAGLGEASDMVISQPGDYQFVLTGTNFVPWIGNAAGTEVYFGSITDHLTNDEKFEVTDVTWNHVGELVVSVTVHDGAAVGPRSVIVINPIDRPHKRDSMVDVLQVE